MPKRLPEGQENADPVRSRLAALASQAAAPASRAATAVAEPPAPASSAEDSNRSVSRRLRPSRLRQERSDGELVQERKARFTAEEGKANDALVELIGRLTDCKPSQASVTRALWFLLRCSEETLKSRETRAPQLKRPPNGFGIETAEFEQELAEFLLKCLKSVDL